MAASLAAETGLTHPAEGTSGVELVIRIGPDHTGAQSLGNPERARTLFAPHSTGQAVVRIVGLRHGLFGRTKGQHRQHRPEDLFSCYAMRLADAGEHGGPKPLASARHYTRVGV